MIRRPPRSTLSSSSAASDVYKRQQCSFLGLSSCRLRGPKSVHTGNGRLLITLRRPQLMVSMPRQIVNRCSYGRVIGKGQKDTLTPAVMHWEVPWFKRGPGHPCTNWRSTVNKYLLRTGITWQEVEVAAQNRSEWRRSVAQCVHLDAGCIKVKVKVCCHSNDTYYLTSNSTYLLFCMTRVPISYNTYSCYAIHNSPIFTLSVLEATSTRNKIARISFSVVLHGH